MSLNTLFKMDLLFSSDADDTNTINNFNNNDNISTFNNVVYETQERSTIGWLFRIVFFIAMFFALFVVVGLTGFHLYLAGTNQTTYEMIKPDVIEKYFHDERKRARKLRKAKMRLERERRQQNRININDDNKDDDPPKKLKQERKEQDKIEIIMKDDDDESTDSDSSDNDDEHDNIIPKRDQTPYASLEETKQRYSYVTTHINKIISYKI